LILRKIIKIVATRCHILKLKCTKFDFGWGSAPDPAGGAHSAPPDPMAGYKGAKGWEGKKDGRKRQGRVRREGRRPTSKAKGREGGKGREGREEGLKGRGLAPQT